MKTTLRALAAPAVALAAIAAAPALAQPASPTYTVPYDDQEERGYAPDVREAMRRAYERGFDRGYRKGVEDGKRMAAPPPPPPPQPVPTGPIRVTRAFYGNDSRSCDATRQVSRAANGRASASFEVSNNICGDPSPGNRKSLDVTYFCGAVEKSASAYEHRTLYLSCP